MDVTSCLGALRYKHYECSFMGEDWRSIDRIGGQHSLSTLNALDGAASPFFEHNGSELG
jgi:hypothetical protein